MDDELTLRYDALSRSHFWLTSKTHVIERFLDSQLEEPRPKERVLEIGCCGGNFLRRYLNGDRGVYGLDVNPAALRTCQHKYPDIRVVQADGRTLPYREKSFDLVILQDVLEHIVDDTGTIRGLNRILRDGGHCFICVPAYKFLFGHHDRVYGHVRRYTRRELRTKLEANGFTVLRATYFQSPFLLPLYLLRRFRKSESDDFIVPPPFINSLLDSALRLESIPIRFMDLPFGPTLMCLARKVRDLEPDQEQAANAERTHRAAREHRETVAT